MITSIIFGLVPARHSRRIDLFPELKATDAQARVRGDLWRHILVTPQVAVSFVLLIVAGLFIRSVANQTALDPGFEPENVGTLSVDLDTQGYDRKAGELFLRQLLKRAELTAGVESATLTRFVPGTASMQYSYTYRETRDTATPTEFNAVGPRYFETLRIPLIRGRDFAGRTAKIPRAWPSSIRLWPNDSGPALIPSGSDIYPVR